MDLPYLEVVIGDPRPPPECPHGPALLFRRIVDDEERLFYACSACRDRKACQFFVWANEEFSNEKKKIWALERQRILPAIDHQKLYIKLMKLLQSPNNRVYCHDCNELLSSNDAKKHLEHDIVDELTDYQIMHPSALMKPLEDPKKEAQYLFSKESTEVIVSGLKKLGCKHILCIGVPRVHEYILSECSTHMDSVLLDIDHRYHQFHGPLQFCWYNVFNNHYFKSASAQVVNDFLQQDSGEGVAIVIDPPFGGRVEPLANTVQQIINQHRSLNSNVDSDLKVMWMFPYFMELHLLSSLPEYKMLDYKVDYDNHPLFTQGPRARKYGSPVRIFTNVSPKEFPLPEEEGYRFCKPCKRWVSAENKHCKKCSNCTSKDGQTYVHCSICSRCVKPSWVHCKTCQRCCIQSHKCGDKPSNTNCYHCGQPGHKKADCKAGPRKRKIDTLESIDGNKKKKQKTDIPKKGMGLKKGKGHNREVATNVRPLKQILNGNPEKEVMVKKGKLQKMNVNSKLVELKEKKLKKSGKSDNSPNKKIMNGNSPKNIALKKRKSHKGNGNPDEDVVLKKGKLQKSGSADDSPKKLKNGKPNKEKKQKHNNLGKDKMKKKVR